MRRENAVYFFWLYTHQTGAITGVQTGHLVLTKAYRQAQRRFGLVPELKAAGGNAVVGNLARRLACMLTRRTDALDQSVTKSEQLMPQQTRRNDQRPEMPQWAGL